MIGGTPSGRSASGSPSTRVFVWGIILLGAAARFAMLARGASPDIVSMRDVVAPTLLADPLHLYSLVNVHADVVHFPSPSATPVWDYPPGFFPWLAVCHWLAVHLGFPFAAVERVPGVFADLTLAWLIQRHLIHGTAARRVAATALVSFGPSFAVVSASYGQLDALAILPAVVAVLVASRPSRVAAGRVGTLIGIGAVVKVVPIFVLVPLLASTRGRRAWSRMTALAVLIPVVALAPFVIADPSGPVKAFAYRGIPGAGGISLLVQPSLGKAFVDNLPYHFNGPSRFLLHEGQWIALAAVLASASLLTLRRTKPIDGAALIMLAIASFGVNFSLPYLLWILPFLLLSGRLWPAASLQIAALPATVESLYTVGPRSTVYVTSMLAVWAACCATLVSVVRDVARRPGSAAGDEYATGEHDL